MVVDRNCHKSILHAITINGAIPVFLMPTRNHYGIIGPIPLSELQWENIERKIAANPFARESKGRLRILTITQSTYDLRRGHLQRRDDQFPGFETDIHGLSRSR